LAYGWHRFLGPRNWARKTPGAGPLAHARSWPHYPVERLASQPVYPSENRKIPHLCCVDAEGLGAGGEADDGGPKTNGGLHEGRTNHPAAAAGRSRVRRRVKLAGVPVAPAAGADAGALEAPLQALDNALKLQDVEGAHDACIGRTPDAFSARWRALRVRWRRRDASHAATHRHQNCRRSSLPSLPRLTSTRGAGIRVQRACWQSTGWCARRPSTAPGRARWRDCERAIRYACCRLARRPSGWVGLPLRSSRSAGALCTHLGSPSPWRHRRSSTWRWRSATWRRVSNTSHCSRRRATCCTSSSRRAPPVPTTLPHATHSPCTTARASCQTRSRTVHLFPLRCVRSPPPPPRPACVAGRLLSCDVATRRQDGSPQSASARHIAIITCTGVVGTGEGGAVGAVARGV
jgi:hypothetical protein